VNQITLASVGTMILVISGVLFAKSGPAQNTAQFTFRIFILALGLVMIAADAVRKSKLELKKKAIAICFLVIMAAGAVSYFGYKYHVKQNGTLALPVPAPLHPLLAANPLPDSCDDALKELGLTKPASVTQIWKFLDGGTVLITLRHGDDKTFLISCDQRMDGGSDGTYATNNHLFTGGMPERDGSTHVKPGSKIENAIHLILKTWVEANFTIEQRERFKHRKLTSKDRYEDIQASWLFQVVELIEDRRQEQLDYDAALKQLGLTNPITLKDVLYPDDGGSMIVNLTHGNSQTFSLTLDRRMHSSDYVATYDQLFIGYPTDKSAKHVEPHSAKENSIYLVLQRWLNDNYTSKQRDKWQRSKAELPPEERDVRTLVEIVELIEARRKRKVVGQKNGND
jgi:hypothetical protein